MAILKVSLHSSKQGSMLLLWPPATYYSGSSTTAGRILHTTTPVTTYLLFVLSLRFDRASWPIVYKKKLDRKFDAKVARLMRFLTSSPRGQQEKRVWTRYTKFSISFYMIYMCIYIYIIDYNLWYVFPKIFELWNKS